MSGDNTSKLDDSESSWSLHSIGKTQKSLRTKKHFPKASSTPVSNCRSQSRSVNVTQYHSTLDDTWIQDSLFAKALRRFEELKQSWVSNCKRSNRSYVRLATVILHCAQGKIPSDIAMSEYPAGALLLLRQGHKEQGTKLCQGYALERSIAEVQNSLDQMKESMRQVTAWRTRLDALYNLLKSHPPASQNTSTLDLRARLILWPAVLCEINGLLMQMDRDLQARTAFLSQTVVNCATAKGAHWSSLAWNHLGTLVRWNTLDGIVDQLRNTIR
ncbi:hypothetical protein D915_009780 [Fasciola hepatica]|uniref:Uncharacterized protein n=1 Tax=Fasciola hepatica TaxID=6192 RepID=A0A4E0RRM3_FASHE|nr:hypothetical protein D915_009780 [Fasciola hepatica]